LLAAARRQGSRPYHEPMGAHHTLTPDTPASAAGELELQRLLQQAGPRLHDEAFIYCSFADGRLPPTLLPICTFKEDEGLTAIVTRHQAQAHGLPLAPEWMLITLGVHSSLDAVGFLAAITHALTQAKIPSNVVSAYFHDHVFVPKARAAEAMRALSSMMETGAGG
jgi:uncharacterized protein